MTRLSLTVYIVDDDVSYCDLGGGLSLVRTAKPGCRVIWSVEDSDAQCVAYDGQPSASYVMAFMDGLEEARQESKREPIFDEDPPGTGRA